MKTKIITVTPSLAQQFIERNHMNQRNLSHAYRDYLAQQMSKGQWVLNGEPIIFDREGNLLDGQHRLHAILKSGVSCEMMIVEGVATSAFATIDSGKTRSVGNVFAIHGVPNYNQTAAIVANVLNYRRALAANNGAGGSLNSSVRSSRSDILKEYNDHLYVYHKAVEISRKCRPVCSQAVVGTVLAMALIDGTQDEDTVECFFSRLAEGSCLSAASPIFKLRERLINNRSSKSKLPSYRQILLTAKAWNLYAMDKECRVLKLDSDVVPPIL